MNTKEASKSAKNNWCVIYELCNKLSKFKYFRVEKSFS